MHAAIVLLALAAGPSTPPRHAPLPLRVSSLGACTAGDWIYAYGGHAGKMHEYNRDTASGRFFRARVEGGKWEELPSGPRVQGMALVAHGDTVIRVGGMQPRNKPGEPGDSVSIRSVARYDPAAKKWVALPDLPAGRSSHEAAMIGDRLYVVGGWEMRGQGAGPKWHTTALVLDLDARVPRWHEFKQPFKRRALGAAALGGKLYVIGGLGAEKATSEVNVYDPEARSWSDGPALPGASRHGFSPAACEAGGRLHVSTSDGGLHRLKADASGWEAVGRTSKRLVHRLVPGEKGRVVLLGGNAAESREVEEVAPKLE